MALTSFPLDISVLLDLLVLFLMSLVLDLQLLTLVAHGSYAEQS